MPYRRRVLLLGGMTVAGGGLIGYHEMTECNEIACFSFEYIGMDDAPSGLRIEHIGGERRLKAGEVYITNVIVDYESCEMDNFTWAELDEELGPDDTINGEDVDVSIAWTDIVKIVWRDGDDDRVIEAWVYDDDVDQGR